MIRALLAAAALAATVPSPEVPPLARPEHGGEAAEPKALPRSRSKEDISGGPLQVLRLLADEDVERARAIAEPYLAQHPDDHGARLAAGVLRIYEQRYAEAVTLIESSELGDPAGYLTLARAARDVTKDYARAEGERVTVSYPKGKDEILVPYLVDTLDRQRAALERALGRVPQGKLAVEIVNDVKELSRLTTLGEPEIRTSGTVAVCKFNKLVILSPKALLKGYDWQDTAAHEYTHLVLTDRSRNQAPIWLQEGLAKWFEQGWRGGNDALSPFSAALVKEAALKGTLVTFDEMHPSIAKLPSQERAALAYAEVVLAVELMVRQGGQPVIGKVLDLLADGKDARDAVAQALGMPFDRFMEAWRRHMIERPLPRGGEHELQRLRFRDDPKHGGTWSEWAEIQDEKSRGFARLGDMMRSRGRWTAARIELGKAYDRVGPRIPILSDQYALAAIQSGQDGLAEKVLSDALGWNPDYPALHVHLARLLARREDWEHVREHLLLANRRDPFDPEIHAGLARALAALGDREGASREERFLRILQPEGHPR